MILIANLMEIFVKAGNGMSVINDETYIGGVIKISKSIRFFRLLYTTNYLKPLDDLIYAFFKTLKEVANYILLIVVVGVTITCIGFEIFANTVMINPETSKPEVRPVGGLQ